VEEHWVRVRHWASCAGVQDRVRYWLLLQRVQAVQTLSSGPAQARLKKLTPDTQGVQAAQTVSLTREQALSANVTPGLQTVQSAQTVSESGVQASEMVSASGHTVHPPQMRSDVAVGCTRSVVVPARQSVRGVQTRSEVAVAATD
jgi:hypothetical protein